MKLNELNLTQSMEGLRKGDFTSVQLTQACLERIKGRNKEINAFLTVVESSAIAEAKMADKKIQAGKAEPLTGIPFCVKDSIATKGVRSTAAAKILDNYIPAFDATVIKTIRDEGGVLLGKNNCDSFGHGASNENSMYGAVKNPYDLTKVSGGSSGGTAVAVADNMCIYGIGEDTGGSIRQPASFCGVVGLRPSYGRNSRFGVMPMASSLDTVGPLAKTVADAGIIMREIAGLDALDATTVSDAVPDYTAHFGQSVKGLKIGVPKQFFEIDGINPEVEKIVRAQIDNFVKLGAKVEEVSLPYSKYAIAVYYILVPSEVSSNFGRLDGVRYGKAVSADGLFDLYAETRAAGFHEEVKRRILIGTYALSAGYYDAYYKKAQQVRTLICREFDKVFKQVDALITPTSPFPAFDLGEKIADPLQMYLADILAVPASIAGIPAISVPAGMTKTGLPVGVQFMAKRLNEDVLFLLGGAVTV